LKTIGKRTGKHFNREKKKTPPTSPHRNPVKESIPSLIDHLIITEKRRFSGHTQPTVQQ
jgi:hypothetical protein